VIDELCDVPDLIEPVIGFRQWRMRDEALWSPFVNERWEPRLTTARCLAHIPHRDRPPAHECTCGIYAWYHPCPRLASALTGDLVSGAVVLWGRIELHPTGMRGEHAAIVALALPLSRGAKRRRLVRLAESLGVDVVPTRALQAAASRHGAPLTDELMPSAAAVLHGGP
jgi:hypothetical protein